MLLEFRAGAAAAEPEDGERCRIYSLTSKELLMRYQGVKIRWTPTTLEVVARDFEPTRELWEFLYAPRGMVTAERIVQTRLEEGGEPQGELPSNQQLGEDYLRVLGQYRHLRQWFSLLIKRNLEVWGRVTCHFQNKTVLESALPVADFNPENETPASKEEAEAIAIFNAHTQPAQDYYESHVTQIESEMAMFVAKNGELPPAVEDGGIFSLYEVHSDIDKIKRDGLKLYMRKTVREA